MKVYFGAFFIFLKAVNFEKIFCKNVVYLDKNIYFCYVNEILKTKELANSLKV